MRALFLASFLFISVGALGQENGKVSAAAAGSVAGTVTCADTNAPARFAVVTLEPVPPEGAAKDPKAQQTSSAIATTDLDGRFVMEKVPPGHYFMLARLAGYLNPLGAFGKDELEKLPEDTRKALLARIPTVSVDPNQSATVTLRLEHAAELSGTVLYDDGSPAVGLDVEILRKNKDGAIGEIDWDLVNGLLLFGAHGITDDRGHYQMIGIPGGEYAVAATLPIIQIAAGSSLSGKGTSLSINMRQGNALAIYSGDVFRKSDIKFRKVGDGESAGGMDITIPLGGLHAIRGTVTAKRDGHALNNAKVDLLYAEGREEVRTVDIDKDGSFAFDYVPEGKYILQVKHGADTEEAQVHQFNSNYTEAKVMHRYGDAEMPLLVQGEISGVELALPDATTAAAKQ